MSDVHAFYAQFQQAQEQARGAGVPAEDVNHVALLMVLHTGAGPATAFAVPALADDAQASPLSPREYLDEHVTSSHRDTFLVAMSYVHTHQHRRAGTVADLVAVLETARVRKMPKNPSDVVGKLGNDGLLLQEGANEEGHQQWRLSQQGSKYVIGLRRPAEHDA